MIRKRKIHAYSGFPDKEIRSYESAGKLMARKAAVEGIVLLKNEGYILPISTKQHLALYGAGATRTIKGGTGSGDVNERHSVSVYEGLNNAGYTITTEKWLNEYERIYRTQRAEWKESILKKEEQMGVNSFFAAYSETSFALPCGNEIDREQAVVDEADTAIYVIARTAGEACDRAADKGDYYISDAEYRQIKDICDCYKQVILIINCGSVMDLSFADEFENMKAIIYCCQLGMEGGNAIADILSGAVSPSGHLTDSWAYHFEDYPGAQTFLMDEREKIVYDEGIFVGYRYFDSFGLPVRYCFGYGLSYTDFKLTAKNCRLIQKDKCPDILISINVENAGTRYAAKEVVQVYVILPQEGMVKEYRRLAGFQKTKELKPGEAETVEIFIPLTAFASYDEARSAWVVEKGFYPVQVGHSLEDTKTICIVEMKEECILSLHKAICPLEEKIKEKSPNREHLAARCQEELSLTENLPRLEITGKDIITEIFSYEGDAEVLAEGADVLLKQLSKDQKIQLVIGDLKRNRDHREVDFIGNTGISVAGSAGETSSCADGEPWNLAELVMADGPAGLRLNQEYGVRNGRIQGKDFKRSVEKGFFADDSIEEYDSIYYQYCSAMPVGTALAQSFNLRLLEELGSCIGKEMCLFGIDLWLAPGMNIHRNPLCGRNFEYYSEDPLLSGLVAAAISKGTQSIPGCGTTIKHFACNNRENDRYNSNSIVAERTLREIYLRGFEIAVKQSQPMSIMTSYNLVNGVHTANSYDLCTTVARYEWGFAGAIVTDWSTTSPRTRGACSASGCVRAGNDLTMPGTEEDYKDILEALKKGTLSMNQLENCVLRIINMVLLSGQYENAKCYMDSIIK